MYLTIPGAPRKRAMRPATFGPGRERKIALIGGAPTLNLAPWNDPSWEFWAHASVALNMPWMRADRFFDNHPKFCFMEERKNGFKNYYKFLQQCPVPIYMQKHYEAIPQSIEYPYRTIKSYWPKVPFGSETAYMIALALLEGVTHLGLWGIHYAHGTEYEDQRPNAERWVGIAEGRGVHVIIPDESPLCHEPRKDYAYTLTPLEYAERKARFLRAKREAQAKGGTFDPSRLVALTPANTAEMSAKIRAVDPAWAAEVAKMSADEAEIPTDVATIRFKRGHLNE